MMRASAHAAKSVMNGTTGFRYRLAGAVFAMKSRKGTGKARRKMARLGATASIPSSAERGEQCDRPAHRIEPQHLDVASRRSERSRVHGTINHNLAIGGDIADGRHWFGEEKRRQGDEDQDNAAPA